ncbi:YbfB/YjiJ family MFS transporter [Comamonadaceae bacterium G21597-S1]|nr:YbfB/YjiJ family MFS transporter [Comamonadaceae bacterium G21597-S1]
MHTGPDPAASSASSAKRDTALRLALVLSLGAAVSLGITRFAYGLLLPPMRDDLGWSYALAGGMNTANAAGYLLGALCTPILLRAARPGRLMIWGALLASVLMAVSGAVTDSTLWLVQRLAAGVASACVFITGGLLAARLGAAHPDRAGWLIGVYYGGTGLGISLSALAVPGAMAAASGMAHPWAIAWVVLAILCFAGAAALRWVVVRLEAPVQAGDARPAASATTTAGVAGPQVPLRRFGFALAGYGMFGVGYIGYMTFIVALLREQGLPPWGITGFYAALGLAVMASPRLWAGLLDRYRDGRPLALLNALLGAATLAPALSAAWPLVLASGLLFGAVFLSVVASTTAWVRHNLPPGQWARGIGAFTIVFAAGQIVGPTVVGWIADGPGGLERGFAVSAVALWLGAALALRQRDVKAPLH